LLIGLFAQAGIAEETLFRGYLFGHLRRRHTFWRTAALSMPPFVAVHLTMFVHLPWPVALASLLLAATIACPLAWLFELGGRTIWAPALLHAVVQGALKLVVVTEGSGLALAWTWMAACAVLPWSVFLLRPAARRRTTAPPPPPHRTDSPRRAA
jgi:membrane protease YdiL (CAAX protease family)